MSGIILSDSVFEIEKRNNVVKKNYFFSHFSLPSKKQKFKDVESVPLPKGSILLSVFHFGCDSWEYRTLGGWSFQNVSVLFKTRRRRLIRVFILPSKVKQSKNVSQFAIFSSKKEQSQLHEKFKKEMEYFEDSKKRELKPNILIIGGSGCGKSSLVNAVFGKGLAEIGSGRPVTQEFTQYGVESEPEERSEEMESEQETKKEEEESIPDNMTKDNPVVIYDSKGIEHGEEKIENFVRDTEEFFQKLNVKPRLESHIHVVWYVVDLTQTRFQPFEAKFCRETLKNFPVVFIFNKSDAVKSDVMEIMLDTVKKLEIPNSIGELATVADRKNFDVKICPKCESPRIRKKLKSNQCTILCKECKEKTILEKTENIEVLKKLTLDKKPRILKLAYIEAGYAQMKAVEESVKKRILATCEKASFTTNSSQFISKLMDLSHEMLDLYKMEYVGLIWANSVGNAVEIFYKSHSFLAIGLKVLGDSLKKTNKTGICLSVLVGIFLANSCVKFQNRFSTAITEGNVDESIIEKLIIDSFLFRIESATIKLVNEEIQKNGNVLTYLSELSFDGNYNMNTGEAIIETKEEEFEIFTKYQEDFPEGIEIQEKGMEEGNSETSENEVVDQAVKSEKSSSEEKK